MTNKTTRSVKTCVSHVNSYDWDGCSRPDRNFHGLQIEPNETVRRREEINVFSTANMYTLTLKFDEETFFVFRIDQGVANGRRKLIPKVLNLMKSIDRTVGLALNAAEFIFDKLKHSERGALACYDDYGRPYKYKISVCGDTVEILIYE